MAQLDISRVRRAHFIGIGGVSMSGLAMTLIKNGWRVTGSDRSESELTKSLRENGVKVYIGHDAQNISPDTELVVYSAAIKPENPEMERARELNAQIVDRAQLMGVVISCSKRPVCVAGTHGKTSTTGMIACIALCAGLDPSVNIGGTLPAIGGNFRVGADDVFVLEACEYCDSFLQFFPYIGVILNIEAEHLDYFRDLEHVKRSFKRFAGNISPEGYLVINSEYIEGIGEGLQCRVVTFGTSDADYYAENISYDDEGRASFRLMAKGRSVMDIKLSVGGRHNVQNATAAAAAALCLGVDGRFIQKALLEFGGAKRRFEYKATVNGITIVDDYAHHPTEIAATLSACKNRKYKRVIVAFQPHTYTRTRLMKEELAAAFKNADYVLLLDIYAAREKDVGDIHSRDLLAAMQARGIQAGYFESFDSAENYILSNCAPGDLLITMGAGDVFLLGDKIGRLDTPYHS